DLLRVIENRGGDGAAEVDIEAGPVALVVADRESCQVRVDATQHGVTPHRAFQGAGVVAFIGYRNGGNGNCNQYADAEAGPERPRNEIEHGYVSLTENELGALPAGVTTSSVAGRRPWCRPERAQKDR